MVVFGVWFLLAGGVALLAGLAGFRRRRRLKATGHTAWAMVLPTPSDAAGGGAGSSGISVQFALEDGRVIEHAHARPVRRSAARRPGERVLVWYDPSDPSDVLVYGSGGAWSDRAFLAVGAVLVIVGAVFAGFG
jgi:hypothetical protein